MGRTLANTPSSSAAMRLARRAKDGLARLHGYVSESARARRASPPASRPSVRELVRLFPPWWTSLDAPDALMDRPWMCLAAVELLERLLRPDHHVHEYGAGGSTVFLSRRVARVSSVEHDPGWHEEVRRRIAQAGITNCDLRLVEPEPRGGAGGDPSSPEAYASGDARFRAASFERYVNTIAEHADASLDLVLVDGRARPSCCRAAMAKIKVGGHLVLDNAEVPYYGAARALFQPGAWALTDIRGPVIGLRHFSETCFFRRLTR